jgi:PKD repeat protein
MKSLKKAFLWVRTQFKTHTLRSLLVTVPALLIVTAVLLWGCGVFEERFSYLPDRAYLLAETDPQEPQTLEELLQSDAPSVDTLLRNPSIAEELLSAQTLTDIVDSRLALNNLRSLDEQLSGWLEQGSEPAGAVSGQNGADNAPDASTPMALPGGSANAAAVQTGGALAVSPQVLSEQTALVSKLKDTTWRLLAPKEYGELVAFPATMNMKGVWQSPNEVLVHMVPSGDWLPEQGYQLYRVVNGQKELIAEQLASPTLGLAGAIEVDGATSVDENGKEINMIQELYHQAQLTPEKLTMLGMSAEEFRALAYRTDTLSSKPRVSGELDFQEMQKALITIPANFEQRIPETDILLGQTIHVLGRQENGQLTSGAVASSLWKKFTVQPAELPTGIDSLGSEEKLELAEKLLGARQQLATLSFVDDEFAEAAGFLIRDNIEELSLPDGTEITYIIESSNGGRTMLSVTKGAEITLSKPQSLLGYGIDGKVPLRWQQAETEQERSILSGYHIERKLNGESEFIQITEEPVAISYILDETDVYFESPVFFEDAVENGRTAEYRIYSIDIFGRRSEYSEVLSLRVEKVTPPNAPSAVAPGITHAGKRGKDSAGDSQMASAVQIASDLNPGKRGIVLPVFTDSPDTVRFTIYRATAVGAEGFGPPEAIANLRYDNPKADASGEGRSGFVDPSRYELMSEEDMRRELYAASSTRIGFFRWANQAQLKAAVPSQPDLIYFDADIEEGCTYKYWISAWDSWNNESAWSQAVSMAVPTDAAPKNPNELFIAMHPRILSDLSVNPPGLIHSGLVTYDELPERSGLPQRPAPEGAVMETVQSALANGITIGRFFPSAGSASYASIALRCPSIIDIGYDNLPQDRYLHIFLGVRGEDVYPDGTARLKWPAYSGDGLGGYVVYRPLFQTTSVEEMQRMSRDELLRMGRWERVNETALTQNQLLVGGINASPGSLSVFLVCLEPEGAADSEQGGISSHFLGTTQAGLERISFIPEFLDAPEGGYVYVDWPAPEDPQVEYYRVYRSEVPSFKNPVDESTLEWTMVGDRLSHPKYTERVDQSFAHYYYYRVTSVSPWGVESAAGAVQRFRVPATKPPQTPNLLLPLQTKDGVKVQFSAVTHCDRYEIYRAAIPRPGQVELHELLNTDKELHAVLFSSPAQEDVYLTGLLRRFTQTSQPVTINPISRLKTLTGFNAGSVINNLSAIDDDKLRGAYNRILEKYGPLALADYSDLSISMMNRVEWVKIGELPSDYDTVEETGALDLLKPLSFTDSTARYGITYLYTVQAWNDDNLGSSRAEPVEATPRRNRPFDPIDGLAGEIDGNKKPSLTWNLPKMAPLTTEQCLEDTVGYIVYSSDTKDGTYYQASPLLFDNRWVDEAADPYAFNWYRVKVLDTGGYLSEFSEPICVRLTVYVPGMVTVIPGLTPPEINIQDSSFTVTEGEEFTAAYELAGTEPITVMVRVTDSGGSETGGISVDEAARRVIAAPGLKAGTYQVTVTARNAAGEDSDSFMLMVSAKPVGDAPRIAFDGSSFTSTYGQEFNTVYELSGTEPIAVTVTAVNAKGAPVSGFSVDPGAHLVKAEPTLAIGSYRVTATAENSAGQHSASFTLTVSTKPVTPPKLAAREDEYNFKMMSASGDLTVQLSATGTEPLVWSLDSSSPRINTLPDEASIDDAGLLTISGSIKTGTYSFIVRVSNAAGSDERVVYLTVMSQFIPIQPGTSVPPVTPIEPGSPRIETPPKLAAREDEYNFKMMSASGDLTVQLSATGTEPLVWSLDSSSPRINTLPDEASIDDAGLLTISGSIKTGTYSFIVRVSNAAGSDERVVYLTVMSQFIPIQPGISVPPVNPAAAGTGDAGIAQLVHAAVNTVTLSYRPSSGQVDAVPLTQFTQAYDYETDQMKCMGFDMTNVKLRRVPYTTAYAGTADLDIGYDTPISVYISNAVFDDGGGASFNLLSSGTVYLKEPVELKNIGLTLMSLNMTPEIRKAQVSGFVKSTVEGQNLAGNLYVFEFENAKLEYGSIEATEGLPQFRYQQLIIKELNHVTIHLQPAKQWDKRLLSMSADGASMKFHLETLNNEGLKFTRSTMSFDLQGRLNGVFAAREEQCLQLLVPGGAGLRVESAVLEYAHGEVKPDGRLVGKLVLPFEKATAGGSLVPAVYAGGHPAHNEMDELASGSGELTEGLMVAMGDTLVHYGEAVQQNSLLILPNSFELQDKCASIPIDLKNWNGEGFVVETSSMDPVRVTNRNVGESGWNQDGFYYTQRAQAVIVSPTSVSVDLNRDAFLPGQAQAQSGAEEILTPKETQLPFWVGIVINGGKLELPSAYIQQKGGGSIEFTLATGEMIYDLNGFSYQTYMYSNDPQGVPAQFGDNLGGFKEVRVKDCLLDMYANRVNLEINANVRIDLFHREWIEAKLFTDEKGKFICSAAPTELEDGLAKDVDVHISGGFFEPEGLKISGQLILPLPGTEGFEIGAEEALTFSNMIVPSDLEKIRTQDGTNRYASVPLDKPVNINFEGFPMEVRGFDIKYTAPPPMNSIGERNRHKSDWVELTLRGATQLSNTIALSDESTDSLVIKCADRRDTPTVIHDASVSVLNNSFDGCVDVVGVLRPKKNQNTGGSLVEFETDELTLNFLGQSLEDLPVTHYARFGKSGDKFYFAVGLTPLGGNPINFGGGNIRNFTGLVAQNMVVEKDAEGRLAFPDNAGAMGAYIKNLQVGGGKFSGGIKGEMTVIKLCTIKDLYFGFEPGPKVAASGEVYMPLDVKSIVNGNPSRYIGKAVIQYRHPERYFSFNLTFEKMNLVLFDFSGSLSFEYSPRLFGVQIGYPETLVTNFQLGPIPVHVGAGLAYRIDEDSASMVRAKFEFGLEKDINIAIVYLRGYIYAGADGAYYFDGPDADRIALELYLKGGINGGIRAAGKRFDIISFYLDARGNLAAASPYTAWDLGCSCKVSYSLDLWLVSVEGSVNARFDTTIG